MTTLSAAAAAAAAATAAAAEARLAEAWETVLGHDPAAQQIIHVLTRPAEYPAWLSGFPPFAAWMGNGRVANDDVWQAFAEIAQPSPDARNARRALAAGISHVRIFVE